MKFKEPPCEGFARFGVDKSSSEGTDYLMWAIAVTPSDESGFPTARKGGPLLEIALQLVRNYDPAFQSFVQHADPEETMLVPIRISSKAAHWPQSNVTLMGDALHLMSPFGGSGGNTALQDATLLAEKLDDALNKNGSVAQALTSYQNDALK